MALDGRITVDVLFHDTDGTASLKVVSLEDSQSYASGKVAIVTGTCGTAAVTIDPTDLAYVQADGQAAQLTSVSRIILNTANVIRVAQGDANTGMRGWASNGASLLHLVFSSTNSISLGTTAGTASYTLVLYGS